MSGVGEMEVKNELEHQKIRYLFFLDLYVLLSTFSSYFVLEIDRTI